MQIRAKVIISLINQEQVLLSEAYDPIQDFKFYIPVGGGVEFGEALYDAAKRELFEELGIKGYELEFIDFHESIFEFRGTPEHEIIFHYVCRIEDSVRKSLPSAGTESNGERFKVAWFSREELNVVRDQIVPPLVYDDIWKELS